jgi:hypothetical protein
MLLLAVNRQFALDADVNVFDLAVVDNDDDVATDDARARDGACCNEVVTALTSLLVELITTVC